MKTSKAELIRRAKTEMTRFIESVNKANDARVDAEMRAFVAMGAVEVDTCGVKFPAVKTSGRR